MIFEFMALGDLAELLRSKAKLGPLACDNCDGKMTKVIIIVLCYTSM